MSSEMVDQERLPRRAKPANRALWRGRLMRYGPLVFWALLIFIGSGNLLSSEHTSILVTFFKWLFPSASAASLAWFHFLVRKAGHLTEYAILATLAARAFRYSSHISIRLHWFTLALLLAMLYALSDELHQSFVPTRTASIHDSLIDSTGALIALTVFWLLERRRLKAPVNQAEPLS